MNIPAALQSGFISTIVMTLVMYLPAAVHLPKVDIVRILGRSITPIEGLAVLCGSILHLVSGGAFALSYAWLWHNGIGKPSPSCGMIFGGVHGVGASQLMKLLISLHPRRPQSWGLSNVVVYLIAHLVFGTLAAALYKPRRTATSTEKRNMPVVENAFTN